MRRLLTLLLLAIVPAGVVGIAGWRVVSSREWARRRLHEVVTVELAQTLGAQVRVGAVRGDLGRGFVLEDVAISEGRSFAEGTLASADEVQVLCDLWPALRGRVPAVETIREVRVLKLHGALVRRPDGKLNIDRFLPKPRPGAPPRPRFRGRITIQDAEITYTDHASRPALLAGLDVRFRQVDAVLDLAHRGALEFAGRAQPIGAGVAAVDASGIYRWAGRAVALNASFTGADAATWSRRLLRTSAARVTAGSVDGGLSLCAVGGKLVDYTLSGRATHVAAVVPRLGATTVTAEAPFVATPAGVRVPSLTASALGAALHGEGMVSGAKTPTLDFALTAEHVNVDRWLRFLPSLRRKLPPTSGTREARVAARVTGARAQPSIALTGTFGGPVEMSLPTPKREEEGPPTTVPARAEGLSVTVAKAELHGGDAVVRVRAGRLGFGDLTPLLPAQDRFARLQPSPLRDMRAEVLYSRATATTAGKLSAERVDTDHGPLRGIEARYAVLGRAVRADVSARDAWGAQVSTRVFADLSAAEPAFYALFDADRMALAKAAELARIEAPELAGVASISGVVAVHGGTWDSAAEVSGGEAQIGRVEVDRFRAHLGLTPALTTVRSLTADGPLGALWASGEMTAEEPLDLELTVAAVPLQQASRLLSPPPTESEPPSAERWNVHGTGFLHGHLGGDRQEPQLTGDLVVFRPGVRDWTANVLTAAVEASPQTVRLSQLLARRRTATLAGEVSLHDLVWPEGSPFAREPAPQDAPPPPDELEGRLNGSLHLTGADLGELFEHYEGPPALRLTGVVATHVALAGTLRDPTARGSVHATHARAAFSPQRLVIGPLTASAVLEATRDGVRFRDGQAASGAGSATFAGALEGWNAEEGARIAADFTAEGLPLAAYTPAEGLASLIEGDLGRIRGALVGPLAAPGPTLLAGVEDAELRLGRRSAQDVSGTFAFADRVLRANNVVARVAGGDVEVLAAGYSFPERKLFAHVRAGDLDARELVFLAADLASEQRPDAEDVRTRLYGLAHRVQGRLSARDLVVGGTRDDLSGRADGLIVRDAQFDHKELPGVQVGFRFIGLRATLDRPPPDASSRMAPAFTRLRVDDLRVASNRIGEGRILVHGTDVARGASIDCDGELDVVAEANLIPLDAVNEWLPRGLDVGGTLALTARAQGPMDDPRIGASVEISGPTVAGVRFDLLQAARIDVEPKAVVMTDGLLVRGANQVQVSGRLPFDRARLAVDPDGAVGLQALAQDVPTQLLFDLAAEFDRQRSGESFWKRCRAQGLLTASLDVTGRLRTPEVRGGISVEQGASFRLADWANDSAVTDIVADVILSPSPTGVGSVAEIANARARYRGADLSLEGGLGITHLDPNELLLNRFENLILTARGDRMQLPGGTVARNVDLAVRAQTGSDGWHAVRVERGSARLGRGTATLTGQFLLDTLALAELGKVPADLRLVLDRAEVAYDGVLRRAEVNGVLVARKFASQTGRPPPEWFLEGRLPTDGTRPEAPLLVVSEGKAATGRRGRLEVTRAILGLPPARRQDEAGAAASREDRQRQLRGLPTSLPAPGLDITVALGPDVRFETAAMEGLLKPDPEAVRLVGTPQAPRLDLRAALRSGTIRLLRGTLEVPEGSVRIGLGPAPGLPDPRATRRPLQMTSEVHGRAQGTVSGTTATGESIGPIEVELELSGGLPPNQVLTTTSSPPMTKDQVYELLAVGPLTPDGGLAPDRAQSVDDMIARALVTRAFRGVLEPLEAEVTRALGLEQFEVTVGLNQPVQLRVGKYLIDNLLVSYTRSAGGPDQRFDLRVAYDLRRKYQVSWHMNEREQNVLLFEYRWTF